MGYLYSLLGLDTLELIILGNEKSPAMSWGLWDHEGPVLDLMFLGVGTEPKGVMLPKDLLEKLYGRFAEANPKGTTIVVNEGYEKYAPPGLTTEEIDRLWEEGKLFPTITEAWTGYPRLLPYLPELKQPEVLERLANDPEVDVSLMRQAFEDGVLPRLYGPRHWRWWPEWATYVEAYKKARSAPPA